jgi:hypothetical protein
MSRRRFGSKAALGMIAFCLVVVAAILAAGSNLALAYKPDVEKCHYEKQCKVVTPYCPPAGQHPKTHPCQAPFTQCTNVKVCVGD